METRIEVRGYNTVTSTLDAEGRVRHERWDLPGHLTISYTFDEQGNMSGCGYGPLINALEMSPSLLQN